MNFDELDKKMRVYEQSLDQIILPEIYLVARLDGRGFTRLTKEICKFEAPFDCRIVPFPTLERVQDYFLWRQEDAHRNSLNAHCYWMLRKEGKTVQEATRELEGQSVGYKNELLFSRGINFDKLPSWQKRGIGVWKEQYEKEGMNPLTGKCETAVRRRLKVEYELPLGEAYAERISSFLDLENVV